MDVERFERGKWYTSRSAMELFGWSRVSYASVRLNELAARGLLESRPDLSRSGAVIRWHFRRP